MLDNEKFLEVIRESFKTYLDINSSRSTAKLKSLHGEIAKDLHERFGNQYQIKSQGFDNDKEYCIDGRYYQKKVDITVTMNNKPVAGYAIKFVMRNYSQNSNNYFENMLGETANIRANSVPYFQIFIIFEKVPYFKSKGEFQRYDIISEHNFEKYLALSKDNPDCFFHTPDKTLIIFLHLKEKSLNYAFSDSEEYAKYYSSIIDDENLLLYSNKIKDTFKDSVILNDYADFIERTVFIAKGKSKK